MSHIRSGDGQQGRAGADRIHVHGVVQWLWDLKGDGPCMGRAMIVQVQLASVSQAQR